MSTAVEILILVFLLALGAWRWIDLVRWLKLKRA
jgi:hypothetical protein